MHIEERAAKQTLMALGAFTVIFTYVGWLILWPVPTLVFTAAIVGTYQFFLRSGKV